MFDYKGYSEEELFELCNEEKADKSKAKCYYWTSEAYSAGEEYRNYSGFPKNLPLCVYSDHGIGVPYLVKHEIENDAEAMFVINKKRFDNFKKMSKKPCYLTKAPFILYKERKKVKQVENPKGTIVFPAHSTPEIQSEFDIKKYIEELKSLPDDMQPVCVCLHMHDINKGLHKIFLENNIPVYTAGNAFDIRYAERFYNILKNFKFSGSNLIGSYLFYSIEIGIPFSLFGEECKYWNNKDDNYEQGKYNYKEKEGYKSTEEMFYGINKTISKEQKEFADFYLKPENAISSQKMLIVLWSAYFKRKILRNLFKIKR